MKAENAFKSAIELSLLRLTGAEDQLGQAERDLSLARDRLEKAAGSKPTP